MTHDTCPFVSSFSDFFETVPLLAQIERLSVSVNRFLLRYPLYDKLKETFHSWQEAFQTLFRRRMKEID